MLAFVVAFVVTVGLPWGAVAQPTGASFGLDNPGWRGLSELDARADGRDIELQRAETLDWSRIEPDQPMILLHPRVEVGADSLASFVSDGGRVLVADDFGAAGSVFGRFGVQRSVPDALPHSTFLRDDQRLPIFHPPGRHALLKGVRTLVANHPALLEHDGEPVVPYDASGGLVYDMKLGNGTAVLAADPSLFINLMMGLADNATFAENVLAYLCRGADPCRPRLYTGQFRVTGSYETGGEGEASGPADSIDESIRKVQRNVPASPLLRYLAMILAFGLLLYLGAVLSLRERPSYSEHIDESLTHSPPATSEFEWNLRRFGGEDGDGDYALPVAILKENFEELFLEEMGVDTLSPGSRPSIAGLADRFAREYLDDCPPEERRRVEGQVRALLKSLARAPTRHRIFIEGDAYFGKRELVQMYRRAMTALEYMDRKEDYERRIRSLV
ncbi:MAG: DUF4350 domain-containing protein [Bradymonadaceae bacterium]